MSGAAGEEEGVGAAGEVAVPQGAGERVVRAGRWLKGGRCSVDIPHRLS